MTAAVAESLSGRTLLVTGSDGFIGSHVVECLIELGARVRAFAMYNSLGSLGWLDSSSIFGDAVDSGQAEFLLGDIRDAEHVAASVEGVDVVLHLAALIAIPYSYVAPRSYVETNVTGTLNVLEAVRRHQTPRLVHTSTSEVYGTPRTVPITEEHALRGQSPYSASKIAADKLAESYALSFGTPVTVLRPFNTFGPRQSARAVIPTVLAQLLAGATELRLGSLTPKRDFTYVTDTALGFARAAVADVEPGTVVQLGTGRAESIGDIVDMARRITGSDAPVVVDEERVRPAGSEVETLLSDPSRARDLIGWTAQVDLETGLQHTADWIAKNVDLARAHRYHR